MKIIVISSSPFIFNNHSAFAYSPYVKELMIWARHSGEIGFFCPTWENDNGLLISKIPFGISKMFTAKDFNIKTPLSLARAFRDSFSNFHKIYQSMKWADHIHLRCPGNIGLMGCIVQILFPNKPKTAKYAGNWDPKSDQPWSYKLQHWILSNTFLTKNMKVLVYGEWEGSSKNIKSFFTASYNESDKTPIIIRDVNTTISFVYVGMLSAGKRPLYAVKLIENLYKKGLDIRLLLYGNGKEKESLGQYILSNGLTGIVSLEGNQPQEIIKKAYQESHFVILPSESEGWPKVIAEGMFWGCVPAATKVSCVPTMLDNGNRGVLLNLNIEEDAARIMALMQNPGLYKEMAEQAMKWSRKYTLDFFEDEIEQLLKS
jgi:glycosyltransferase involved in cell wall biosynthesis